MESHDNDTQNEKDANTDTAVMTSIHIDTPNVADTSNVDDASDVDDTSPLTVDDTSYVNGVTLSSDAEITTIYDIATNTIINMYNFLYAYSEYCVDHNMV
jgi:hypothetical protein